MSSPKCKQIHDLTLDDFEQFPIWEFLSEDNDDAEDELTVKGHSGPYDSVESMCVVLTKFYLKDGSSHLGFIDPAYFSRNTQATIFFPPGAVSFWFGAFEPSEAEMKEYYNTMEKTDKQVFPILWEALVPISRRFAVPCKLGYMQGPPIPQSGTIEGFGYIDAKNRKTIYKT